MKPILLNFRKIHFRLIDIVVVALFLFVVAMVGYFLLRQGTYVPVVVRITDSGSAVVGPFSDSSIWYGDIVSPGMVQHDQIGRKVVEVLDKKIYPTGERSKVVDLTLNVRAVYDKRSKQYTFDGTPLTVGSVQRFSLNSFLIRGFIRDVNNRTERQHKLYRVKGILNPLFHNSALYGWAGAGYTGTPNTTGIPTYLANSLVLGEKIDDQSGEELARIMDITKNPAFFVLVGQQAYSIIDSHSTEVQLEVLLKTEMIAGQPVYLGIFPLLVNASLPFYFPGHTITLTVTSFEEVK